MSLLLFILVQAQEPPRLSKAVIAGAVVVLLVGLSLLVYFFRRYKTTEKEVQDEWDLPEQGLFRGVTPSLDRSVTAPKTAAAGTVGTDDQRPGRVDEAVIARPGSRLATDSRPATQELKSDQPPTSAPAPVPETAPRPTELLSSEANRPEIMSNSHLPESSPLDDILPTTDETSQEVASSSTLPEVKEIRVPALSEQQRDFPASVETVETEKPRTQTELLGTARVDARPPREPFEPPSITPIVHREHWATPRIEPLKPRTQPPAERIEQGTQILASPPAMLRPAAPETELSTAAETQHPVLTHASVRGTTARVPSGSVLGLPAERSDAPFVYGKPARAASDAGIGDLSAPWKTVDSGGGHGGTIALAAVILLLGGAIAAYMFLPAVNTKVNAMVARARGIDPNPPAPVDQPKARVLPARNEANKTMVKARGAVDNISEETLSNLSVEVSLERGNGAPPVLRRVPVNPAQLTPKQRGVFEFEYDGNRATGFGGYRILRLVSGEEDIKFTTPRAG